MQPNPLRRAGYGLARGLCGLFCAVTATQAQADTAIRWMPVAGFEIARTETTVAQFRAFVRATGTQTLAERRGGGEVYESGWVRKPGWTWRTPFGAPAADDEPAVHITWPEAQAFCRWAGARLPRDAEWALAAHTEQRTVPQPPFERGRRYAYPTGDSPLGAHCLDDCGPATAAQAQRHGARLLRGLGHVHAGQSAAGVNGLHEMGGNAWEWVDDPPGAHAEEPRRTRGGSWWYGAAQMQLLHHQAKPPDTAVVYIGFRCLRER